jgi:hypothetical protein
MVTTAGDAPDPAPVRRVLDDVATECRHQDEKWGQQDLPNILGPIIPTADLGKRRIYAAALYGIPTADAARQRCDSAAAAGCVTWGHVAVEELAEAIEAALVSEQDCRAEVVQLSAVCQRWVESIDRRSAGQS